MKTFKKKMAHASWGLSPTLTFRKGQLRKLYFYSKSTNLSINDYVTGLNMIYFKREERNHS